MSTEERIDDIIKYQLGPIKPQPFHELEADLGADSLDIVEMMIDIEDQLDIAMDQDDFEALKTVGEVYEFVKRHIGEGA